MNGIFESSPPHIKWDDYNRIINDDEIEAWLTFNILEVSVVNKERMTRRMTDKDAALMTILLLARSKIILTEALMDKEMNKTITIITKNQTSS